jgi:hypothetical protein
MSSLTTLLRQLEAYVQEEIGAQTRLVALLEAQERALRVHDAAELLDTTSAIDAELEGSAQRGRRRRELFASLAGLWMVAPSSLTLSSIALRAGPDAQRLERQKDDLDRAARRVQRLARRSGLVARFHQRLTADVLQALLAAGEEERVDCGGRLVDAEG